MLILRGAKYPRSDEKWSLWKVKLTTAMQRPIKALIFPQIFNFNFKTNMHVLILTK